MVQVNIKHVTIVIANAAIAYHILEPIDLAGLRTREELKRTKVQDTVRRCTIMRYYKVVSLKGQSPSWRAANECCIRVPQHQLSF